MKLTPQEIKTIRQAKADRLEQLKGRQGALSDDEFLEFWKMIRDEATLKRAINVLELSDGKGSQKGSAAAESTVDRALQIIVRHYQCKAMEQQAPASVDDDDVTIGYEMNLPVPMGTDNGDEPIEA
jgi:hypothetical protein